MNGSNESSWRDWYRAAVVELKSSLIQIRVNEALAAINARASYATASRAERREIDDALSTLRQLKKVDR
jgi:inhibitor of KinA sporulation pathway (predicted exonuclease)